MNVPKLTWLIAVSIIALPATACGRSSMDTVTQTVTQGGVSTTVAAHHLLTLPFRSGTPIHVSEGWIYSAQEQAIHGLTKHGAIDFAEPIGTPVVASSDGYAIGTYELHYADKTYDGKRVDFGYGRVVMIWDPKEHLVTLYGHLSEIAPNIHYVKPQRIAGIWRANALNWSPAQLEAAGTLVKRGQQIGTVGLSGLGLGFAESPNRVPMSPSESWDEPHLHFEVYIHAVELDPFDVYGRADQYQALQQGPKGLWLTDNSGKPRYP